MRPSGITDGIPVGADASPERYVAARFNEAVGYYRRNPHGLVRLQGSHHFSSRFNEAVGYYRRNQYCHHVSSVRRDSKLQ